MSRANIAQATDHLALMTAVTCPIMRYHPAIVAQAAAALELLSNDRFPDTDRVAVTITDSAFSAIQAENLIKSESDIDGCGGSQPS
jgi:hypothetical protein